MSSHRRAVRPRYARIVALAISVTVSAVAALAGLGVLATSSATPGASARPASYHEPRATGSGGHSSTTAQQQQAADDETSGSDDPSSTGVGAPQGTATSADVAHVTGLPADSGRGRRIVFSQSRQRVWLVDSADGSGGSDGADTVDRTYPVSGSIYDNLQPGTYSVYSKSRWAVGVEDTGVMQYFVRFTQGPTGAAIGFHSIPTHDGAPLEKRSQLGTPQSHGCIRQDLPDAIALWNFAPVGTKVVVVA
jgi:lipoprotein-anchoring transpeptidase ErfK/SrfK